MIYFMRMAIILFAAGVGAFQLAPELPSPPALVRGTLGWLGLAVLALGRQRAQAAGDRLRSDRVKPHAF